MEAERRLRGAPVLGRSNVQKSKGRENLNARALMETAAPEDGRTPPPSLRSCEKIAGPFFSLSSFGGEGWGEEAVSLLFGARIFSPASDGLRLASFLT